MFNMDSKMFGQQFFDRMFREVNNVVWDLMTGNLGVATKEGIATLDTTEEDNPRVSLNLFDQFGVALPAYAQNTPVDQVKVGDLIVGTKDEVKGWVIEVKNGKFSLMTPSGTTSTWTPPKVQMLGFDSGVMVLRSLMSMLPNGQQDLGNLQNMMLPMLMMSKGGKSNNMMKKMMPMMLFSQMNGGAGAGGMGNMMQTMMLMDMMRGDDDDGDDVADFNNRRYGNFFDSRDRNK